MINIFIGIVFPVVWKIGSSELTKNGDGEAKRKLSKSQKILVKPSFLPFPYIISLNLFIYDGQQVLISFYVTFPLQM